MTREEVLAHIDDILHKDSDYLNNQEHHVLTSHNYYVRLAAIYRAMKYSADSLSESAQLTEDIERLADIVKKEYKPGEIVPDLNPANITDSETDSALLTLPRHQVLETYAKGAGVHKEHWSERPENESLAKFVSTRAGQDDTGHIE